MTETLTDQLAAFREAAKARTPAERSAMMERHIAHLQATGILSHGLKVGDKAPAIVLPSAQGGTLDVATLLATGPVIVTFYRGGWCPYCNLELKAYEAILPRLAEAGAHLVAISPERPDLTVTTAEKDALTFPVLSDVGSEVGKAFGIVYEFTDELRQVYDMFNNDMSDRNGTPGVFSLPLTATYVIGQDNTILYADAGTDYRHRPEPLDVLALVSRRAAAE